MKYLDEQKFVYGAILIGNPRWNKKDAPGTLPVNNLPGWSGYVTEPAKHVRGRVKYFEVWNEPPNFTGKDQTPADYAKLVVAAYDAVKAVDPACPVALAAKSAHVNYLEQVIKAGAKDHFDCVILHPCEVLDGVADGAGSEAVFMSVVPTVRKMLAAQNPGKVDVPIIFTELGADAKRGPTARRTHWSRRTRWASRRGWRTSSGSRGGTATAGRWACWTPRASRARRSPRWGR